MISEEQQAEFKAKFGDELVYHEAEAYGGVFIFKKPSRQIYKKFQTMAQRKNADAQQCAEQMVIDCYCFPRGADDKPDYPKLAVLFDAYPALPDRLFTELYELAAGRESASGKL